MSGNGMGNCLPQHLPQHLPEHLPKRKSVAVEALESRVCLSDAVAGVGAARVAGPAGGAFQVQIHSQTQTHEVGHAAAQAKHVLPGHGTYSVMAFGKSVDAAGYGRAEQLDSHLESPGGWNNGKVRFADGSRAGHVPGFAGMHAFPLPGQGQVIAFVPGSAVLPVPLPGMGTNPDPVVWGDSAGATTDAALKPDTSTRGGAAARGETQVVRNHVITANGKTMTTYFVTTEVPAVTVQTIPTPVASTSSSRQALAEMLDRADSRQNARTASASRISESTSNPFASLAQAAARFGSEIVQQALPRFHVPSAEEIAAQLQAAAVQATARVVVTSQPMLEFAHMGSPFKLVADSMAAFIEESAVVPSVVAQARSQGPWVLTAGVVAADLIVLTYLHRRGTKAKRRVALQVA